MMQIKNGSPTLALLQQLALLGNSAYRTCGVKVKDTHLEASNS